MTLQSQKRDWEDLSALDPFWAILSAPEGRHGNWDVEEFFHTGEGEIQEILEVANRLGHPRKRQTALDFGCGVGRLTRVLGRHFERCYGVDISLNMVGQARQLNSTLPNCEFVVNDSENLAMFPDNYFDLIYTNIVLQHIPSQRFIKGYIGEFVRTLADGGLLVFQLPSHIPLKNRLQPRSKAYSLLKSLGISRSLLYERLGLHPIKMNFVPEKEVLQLLDWLGALVLEVKQASPTGSSFVSNTYFVAKRAL